MMCLVPVTRTSQSITAIPCNMNLQFRNLRYFQKFVDFKFINYRMEIKTLTIADRINFQFLFSNPDGIERFLSSILFLIRPRGGRIPNHLFY